MVVQSLRPFLYNSSVYSCLLFLISSVSVRSLPFLSFIVPILAWNVPLIIPNFLEDISSLSSISLHCSLKKHFPGGLDGEESASNAWDLGLIPGWGRSPWEGNDNPLQYSCLGIPMDRGAWRLPWGFKASDMTERPTFSLLNVILDVLPVFF